jgi:hypothetical protein
MDAREEAIEDAFVNTFDWVLPTSGSPREVEYGHGTDHQRKAMLDFAQWITRTDQSLFWICGKAGSGKSTLMKKIANASSLRQLIQGQSEWEECLVASFWFSEQSKVELLKTREGMLRSLLYQLLKEQPRAIKDVFPEFCDEKLVQDRRSKWSCKALQTALQAFFRINRRSRILLLVDGLDEYDFHDYEDYIDSNELDQKDVDRVVRKSKAHSEIGEFFKTLAKCPNSRICVASRPKKFDTIFYGHPGFRLEDLTAADITTYVKGKLAAENVPTAWELYEPDKWHQLQVQIVKDASGVFLWVKLIVEILTESIHDNDTIDELREKLASLPTELGGRNGLYMRMLGDIKIEHRAEAALLIDMVQVAGYELQLLTTCFAVLTDVSSIVSAPLAPYSVDEANKKYRLMKGRLRSRCSGLLECRPRVSLSSQLRRVKRWEPGLRLTDRPFATNFQHRVQFIHLTFYDFLQRPYAQDYLKTMRSFAPAESNVYLALAQGLLGSLKFLPAPFDIAWYWIRHFLFYAQVAEEQARRFTEKDSLFDEMDRVTTWLFQDRFPDEYWYMTKKEMDDHQDSMENPDAACIAVAFDFKGHVQRKLELKIISNTKPGRRSLLEYAICPPIDACQAGPEMVRLLLQYGADPNEAREQRPLTRTTPGSDTVWHELLQTEGWESAFKFIRPLDDESRSARRQEKEGWYEIALILLEHGADATSLVEGERDGRRDQPRSTLYYAHDRLCPEKDLQDKLYCALEKAGAMWLPGEKEHECKNCPSRILNPRIT